MQVYTPPFKIIRQAGVSFLIALDKINLYDLDDAR